MEIQPLSKEELLKGIAHMQRIQERNPPSSENWKRASEVMRQLVGKLNEIAITPEMWGAGVTK